MNRIIFSALLLSGVAVNAQQQQVGINTAEPKATLHVEAGASENKGVIIPRITAAEMKTMTAGLGADHHAIITYLKDQLPAADQTGKLAEVSEAGYYFYNHTIAKWQKFGGGAEQDLRAVGNNDHITKDAGIGENGTSAGTGYRNIGIGQKALLNGTSGSDNIAIGSQSLKNLTTGHRNVAIGSNTLENNTTGTNNVGIGSAFYFPNGGTISSNTNVGIGTTVYSLGNGGSMTGNGNNIGLGNSIYTLQKVNAQFSGNNNTAIGQSIFNLHNGNLTGTDNIAMGQQLYTMQSGDMAGASNIALGKSIYTSNKTTGAAFSAYRNIGIGESIFNLENGDFSGVKNIAMGNDQYTLDSGNMEGFYNIGIGQESYYVRNGNIASTAIHNIALGNAIYRLSNSSTSTFSGENNIGIGYAVYNLNNNLSGNKNIGMGYSSYNIGTGTLTGSDNIGIGSYTFYVGGSFTGRSNISIGSSSLGATNMLAGNYNIALGEYSLYTNAGGLSGSKNIGIGYYALHTNGGGDNAGSNNIAIGEDAMRTNGSGYNGSNNIAIGKGTLYASLNRGSYNIAIGDLVGLAAGNGNIHIGNDNIGTPVAGQLNNVVAIGNEVNGLGITNTDSNTILLGKRGSDGPKVGIGTYKPGAKLEINNGTTAGAVKIVDGTEGAGKVLTSDANGLATWKRQTLTLVEGVKGSGISIPPSTWGYIYTGSYITLPPGKYMVSVQNLMSVGFTTYSDGHFWLRTTFSDSDTTFVRTTDIDSTKGYLISGLLPQGARFSMLNGSLIIENTTSSPKTYYYWAGQVDATPGTTKPLQNFGGWAEWSMTATPIQ